MKIYSSVTQLVGHTPLVRLEKFEKAIGAKAAVIAKVEGFNPGGSAKDRVALSMLDTAQAQGLIAPGATLIEPTSGNTGIGLAVACAARGYSLIIVMPDSMSPERIRLMEAYGAKVVLTPGAKGMSGAIEKAEELHASIPGSWIPGQFTNPANPKAHYDTTGPEIYEDTEGQIAAFVAGIGTGGTITGTAQYLKEQNGDISIIGVEPSDSPLLTKGIAGPHRLQGIGANFVPEILKLSLIDRILPVSADDAVEAARFAAQKEGILLGFSGGAALYAAGLIAKETAYEGKNVVVLLPDSGERYLSTDLF